MSDMTGESAAKTTSAETGENDYLKLRQLLLGEDYFTAINRYISRDDDVERLTQALPEALKLVEEKELGESLAPIVDEAINVSIEENPARITDILFPIMGPAIRKAVATALSEMVQSLNTLLEQSLSLGSLKWRFSAWRAGMPYAKYVLLQTTQYRVEQVLLVHRETGLLLNSVIAPDVNAQDPELVSSMLTAISDFVSDSFSAGKETLERIRFGDLELQLLVGPHAIIAIAVRGSASDELIALAHQAIEQLHADFHQPLIDFQGDRTDFEPTSPLLSTCLLTKKIPPKPKKIPWLALGVLTALTAYMAMGRYESWQLEQSMGLIHSALANESGYVVISTSQIGVNLNAQIIRDKNSRTPSEFISSLTNDANIQISINDRIVNFVTSKDAMTVFIQAVDAINNTRFYFESNASHLSADELTKLPALIQNLNSLVHHASDLGLNNLQLMILGFADSSGTQEKNRAVSQERAQTIQSLLQENIDSIDFLVAWGLGHLDGDGIAEPLQRRVSFQLFYSGAPSE